jgi:hypothetical protein
MSMTVDMEGSRDRATDLSSAITNQHLYALNWKLKKMSTVLLVHVHRSINVPDRDTTG